MTKLNHENSIFKLIDSLKRERRINIPEPLSKLVKKHAATRPPTRSALPLRREEQRLIQDVCLGVFDHLSRSKDIRVVSHLLDAVANETDRTAVRLWFCKHAAIKTRGDGITYDRDRTPNRYEALSNPYWTLIPKRIPKGFNFEIELTRLVEKATERSVAKHPEDEVDPALLAGIKRLIASR
ncbi:MAG: hypothetical protein EOS03_00595 [Mesorhizobium sp.]|uniref:hypothetical protein n=1 Tax=Mesorhizobium sp. TaxID=1871066 RepID=UPI000FE9A231|nr:hypothetical protein [Mesorhizobium sp.]RWN48993.1 MAG: hypothetical protein EOS03_00595 [Mesorhizobium sp.]